MDEFEEIKKKLDSNAVRIDNVIITFLDVSSTCTGACSVKVDFLRKNAVMLNANSIWLPDVEQDEKCNYMYQAVTNYFNIVEKTDFFVLEKYSINPRRLSGCLVTPEIFGALKAAMSEVGIKHTTWPPQSWRKQLGIKKNSEGDFKLPTKEKVLTYVQVPEKIISNITHNERNTSSDLYDVIAIAVAWLDRMGVKNIDFSKIQFQTHVGVLGK